MLCSVGARRDSDGDTAASFLCEKNGHSYFSGSGPRRFRCLSRREAPIVVRTHSSSHPAFHTGCDLHASRPAERLNTRQQGLTETPQTSP